MRVTTLTLPLAFALAAPLPAHAASVPVAEVANIRFYSDELTNLHHFLYAWAWRTRTEGRPLSQRLAAIPTASFTPDERAAWDAAVGYCDRELASKDLLFGEGMSAIKLALTRERLADIRGRVASLRDDVVPRLETLYATPWFASPERADIVWVGNWAGGYATVAPTHATISSTHPSSQGWEAAEIVFHEYSHILVNRLTQQLNAALGDGVKQHGVLWHTVQFYLTGHAVRVALSRRGIVYAPSIERMFQGAWPHYRQPVTSAWEPYFEGRGTMDDAIARTVAALGAPK